MSSEPLEAYRHTGKFTWPGVLLPVLVAAAIAYPLGLVYSLLIGRIPFIYVNVLITLGYGLVFGWISGRLVQAGKVRNNALALLVGALAGIVGLYFDWNGHLRNIMQGGPALYSPGEVLGVIPFLYDHGSWGLKSGGNVTGPALAAVWLAEALLIVGLAAYLPWRFVNRTPFCEQDQVWLRDRKVVDTLGAFTDPAQRAALAAGDITPLTQARPRAEDDAAFTRLLLKRADRCGTFCTVRIQEVRHHWDDKGRVKETAKDLTGDLVLPSAHFDLITKFESLPITKA